MQLSRPVIPKSEREVTNQMGDSVDTPACIRRDHQVSVRHAIGIVDVQAVTELAAIIEPAVQYDRHTGARIDKRLPVDRLTPTGAPPSVRK
jgi:hypothetical protein